MVLILTIMRFFLSENEESPPFVGYDPSHPTIFLTLFKWYDDPEKAAEHLIELYPHALPLSPTLSVHY